MLRLASSPEPSAYSSRTGRRPARMHRPDVGPDRVDVLVDPRAPSRVPARGSSRFGRARGFPRSAPRRLRPRRVTRASSQTIAPRSIAWWSVATQKATSKLPSANGSRSPSAWMRRYRADALHEEAASAEADHRVDDEVAGDVLAAERHEMLRGPALRGADLEHAVAGPDVAGRAGAESRARSRPRSGSPSRARGSGTAAPRRSGRRPRTSPARGRARASRRSRGAWRRSRAPRDRAAPRSRCSP